MTTSLVQNLQIRKADLRPQVESTVARLLVSIKQLLESLTAWSLGNMPEDQVSDIYVQLGNHFNACVTAFKAHDIDMRYVPRSLSSDAN